MTPLDEFLARDAQYCSICHVVEEISELPGFSELSCFSATYSVQVEKVGSVAMS
jgi:hypothetical protein